MASNGEGKRKSPKKTRNFGHKFATFSGKRPKTKGYSFWFTDSGIEIGIILPIRPKYKQIG